MVCRKVCQCVGCILRRTWHRLCRLSGRKPQTEGNQLHSFRSICGRGTEARNHQSDRTGNAGDRCSDPERVIREDHKQYAGVQEPWCIPYGHDYLWQLRNRRSGELRCLCAEGGRAFHGQPCGDTATAAGILCQCRKGTGCR